ncbi:MAG: NUDIX domain-containing protein [Candidatus Limnocylindrales bacterium]
MAEAERVLGVPRAILPAGGSWYGLLRDGATGTIEAAFRAASFRPRAEAETDVTWKQLIPYLVLRDGRRIFLMRRTRRGGDTRLYGRYTIGVGGHVNPGDRSLEDALRREWHEELEAQFEPDVHLVGLLNDDSDPVGAVHLGVVYEADAGGRAASVRESEKLQGGFASPEELLRAQDRMETWSRLLVAALLEPGG